MPVGSFSRATIAERVEWRAADLPGWFTGRPTGRPASEFWMRFTDGRDADLLSLLLLVDSAPPPVLELGRRVHHVELTVHLRASPARWLACRATTRFVSGATTRKTSRSGTRPGTGRAVAAAGVAPAGHLVA